MTKKVCIEKYIKDNTFGDFYRLKIVENDVVTYHTFDIDELEIEATLVNAEKDKLDNILNCLKFLQKEFKYMLLSDSEIDNAVKSLGCFIGRCDCLLHMVSHQIDALNEEKTIED